MIGERLSAWINGDHESRNYTMRDHAEARRGGLLERGDPRTRAEGSRRSACARDYMEYEAIQTALDTEFGTKLDAAELFANCLPNNPVVRSKSKSRVSKTAAVRAAKRQPASRR